ncbi:MAG: thiamine pyrophosphate-binding protein [Pseudomonadota bacterium]
MKVSDYVFSFFREKGLKSVFYVPGGGNMFLVDALARCDGIEGVPMHHEQACAMAAEALSHLGGCPGVALVTSGPGSTNALTGVGEAYAASVPMVIISGQVKRADLKGTSGLRQKGAQEVDIEKIAADLTKFVLTVRDPQQIRASLEKAYRIANEGRPGPVWLDIPLDVQASEIEPAMLAGEPGGESAPPAIGDEIAHIANLIRESKRPLLMAGHGMRLSGGKEEFVSLVNQLGMPVVTTWIAADLLPHAHPLLVGRPGAVALRAANFAVQNADLLIILGSHLDHSVTAFNPDRFGRSAKRVWIDIDPVELAKFHKNFEIKIAVDAKYFVQQLSAALASETLPEWRDWKSRCADWKARYGINMQIEAWQNEALSHYEVIDAFSDLFPSHCLVVTGGSGLAIESFYVAFRTKEGQRVFSSSGLGSMGYGLPAAIGACIGRGGGDCICVESDGSLMMNLQELATLKGQSLPIKLFIINNDGYASIRNTQLNYFEGRQMGTGPEAGLLIPSFRKIAEAIGIPAIEVRSREELHEAITRTLATEGPVVCEIFTTRFEALLPKAMAIPQANGTMLSMPLEDMTPLLPRDVLRSEMFVPLSEESEKVVV